LRHLLSKPLVLSASIVMGMLAGSLLVLGGRSRHRLLV
jgi:hypothetical protein